MAVRGDSIERIEQSQGLYNDPGMLVPPSFFIDTIPEDLSQYGASGNEVKDGVKVHVFPESWCIYTFITFTLC